jgi:sulfide dehydrogenase [flavocytochrome c] flavoprotein chain
MVDRIGPDFGAENVEVDPDTMEVVIDGDGEQGRCLQRDPGAEGGQRIANRGADERRRLGAGEAGRHALDDGRERLGAGRRHAAGRHAEIRLLGQQPGQGRGDGDPGRADRQPGLPGALLQHLLVADRGRGRREGRRGLRADRGEDRLVSSFISQTGEDAALRRQTYEESLGWYAGITSDMFG